MKQKKKKDKREQVNNMGSLNVKSNIRLETVALPLGTALKDTQVYRLNGNMMTDERKQIATKSQPHDESLWTLLNLQEYAFQELSRAIVSLPKYVDTYEIQQKRYEVLQAAGLATDADLPKHTPMPHNIAKNIRTVQIAQVRLDVLKAAIRVEMNQSNSWSQEVLSFNIKAIEISVESVLNNKSTVSAA
jgi:hypothetical protein